MNTPCKTVRLSQRLSMALVICPLLGLTPALASNPVQLAPVGPTPAGEHIGVTVGYLIVATPTEEHPNGEGMSAYIHTSYRILSQDGKYLRRVNNHSSTIDEDAEKVELAPGTYTVIADSDKDGIVRVPVIIKRAQVTRVILDGSTAEMNPAKAVRAPSGEIIGWKASS